MSIIYFGYNSFKGHKRGVENVIEFQSKVVDDAFKIYIYFGERAEIYRFNSLICISLKKTFLRFLNLNLLIYKIARRNKHILIHSHNYLMSFFLLRKTDLFTVHDSISYQFKCLRRYPDVYLANVIERIVYLKTTKVHFISNFTKSKSLFKKKTGFYIIPNTSYLESFKFDAALKIPSCFADNEYVFTVRSIEERARIDLLIDVAQTCQEKGNKLGFIVAGKGPLLDFYKDLVKKKNLRNIQLLGFISDKELVYYYQHCKLVLMIAEYGEGFGLPLIEGYFFNKPVIASNRCAIPEVIISNNYLFDNSVDSIMELIEKKELFENKLSFKDYYMRRFGWKPIKGQYRILYDSFK